MPNIFVLSGTAEFAWRIRRKQAQETAGGHVPAMHDMKQIPSKCLSCKRALEIAYM